MVTISLVGCTNVGKSTLFNVLSKSNDSMIVDMPGTTRDIIYGKLTYRKNKYIICDTPGISLKNNILNRKILKRIKSFLEYTDIILLIVDFSLGIRNIEYEIMNIIHKSRNQNILLMVNKSDKRSEYNIKEFYKIGIKTVIPISAKYNLGIKKVLDTLNYVSSKTTFIKSKKNVEIQNLFANSKDFLKKIKVSVIGNLNVGKSTLINRLIKQDRLTVQNAYGTTRDPIFIHHVKENSKYVIVDTAGIRKRFKTKKLIEHLSISKSLQVINISNVIFLVIDITRGIRKQDLSLIKYIYKSGKSLIIFFNKSDLVKISEKPALLYFIKKIIYIYKNVKYFFISATEDKHFNYIWKSVDEIYKLSLKSYSVKIINYYLKQALLKYPPPIVKEKKKVKLKYAHVGGKNPLVIIIHGSHVKYIDSAYKRYLKNFFNNRLILNGIRIEIYFKENYNR